MTRIAEYTIHPSYILETGPPIVLQINGQPFLALLDTGASRSVIDTAVARNMQLVEDDEPLDMIGATGQGRYPQFRVSLYIPILELTIPSPVPSLPLRESGLAWAAIIGRDVLCQYEFTVNGQTGLIRFTKE